jgi:hypothetical protein
MVPGLGNIRGEAIGVGLHAVASLHGCAEKLRAHIGSRGGIAIALYAAGVTPALSGLISAPLSLRNAGAAREN